MQNRRKPVRVVASDWGKVVADFDNMKMAEALTHHASLPVEARELHDIMLREQRGVYDAYMRGHLSTEAFRLAMRRILQLHITDEGFDRIFVDVFTLNQPIVDLWARLRKQGVKLVAASNVEELRHAKLKELGVHDMFDTHCLSYEVGANKPEDAFFHRVAKLAYADPGDILFVDDHAEFVEVATSRRHLMQGLVYDISDHAAFEKALEGFTFERYQR